MPNVRLYFSWKLCQYTFVVFAPEAPNSWQERVNFMSHDVKGLAAGRGFFHPAPQGPLPSLSWTHPGGALGRAQPLSAGVHGLLPL